MINIVVSTIKDCNKLQVLQHVVFFVVVAFRVYVFVCGRVVGGDTAFGSSLFLYYFSH